MDLSKLPKLSNTSESAPPPSPSEPLPPVDYRAPAPQANLGDIGAGLWFNAIVGLLLVVVGRNFASYALSLVTGHPYHTGVNWTEGDHAGQEVSYPDLQGYVMLTDAAVFLFGLVVLLEALVKAIFALTGQAPKALIAAVLALAAISTAFNLYVCVRLMSDGYIPFISALAAAFGGYILLDLWRLMSLGNQSAKPV